jgi:hypothetical protein
MEKIVGLQTKKCAPCKGGEGLTAMDEADANKLRNQVCMGACDASMLV